MAEEERGAELRFATIHRAPDDYVLPKGASRDDVPGLLTAELVRDACDRSNRFVCTWSSKEASDAHTPRLAEVFRCVLTPERSGYTRSLERPQCWWRRAWNKVKLTSNHFLAVLAGVVAFAAACSSVLSLYGAFFSEPQATFLDSSLTRPDEVASTMRNVVAGESTVVELTLTNTCTMRGSALTAKASSLDRGDLGAGLLAGLDWDEETLALPPLKLGESHIFRVRVRAAESADLMHPGLGSIEASLLPSDGYWGGSKPLSTTTGVYVWPGFGFDVVAHPLMDSNKAELDVELHFGRAVDLDAYARVTVTDGAAFEVLLASGVDLVELGPPSGDVLEWSMRPQPAFHTSLFTISARRKAEPTQTPWSDLAKKLKVTVMQGNPK